MTMLLWKSARRVMAVNPSTLGMVLSLLSAAFSSVRLCRPPMLGGSRMILLLNALISVSDVIVPRLSGREDSSFLYTCRVVRDTRSARSSGSFLSLLSDASSVCRLTRSLRSGGSSVRRFSEQLSAVSVSIFPSPGGIDTSLFWIMLSSLVSDLAAASSRCEARRPPASALRATVPFLDPLLSLLEEHPMAAKASVGGGAWPPPCPE
mmetsp:Transcript_2245/g.4516  ORF Transcript_2245/g.4516 Transcript_2245/m.4516 type:complete len:207 (-) Transcript_2245:358-978(-)